MGRGNTDPGYPKSCLVVSYSLSFSVSAVDTLFLQKQLQVQQPRWTWQISSKMRLRKE